MSQEPAADLPSEFAIHTFWSWLQENQEWIQVHLVSPDDSNIAVEISKAVDTLNPELRWEIGPSQGGLHKWFFALSPGGSRARLTTTRHVLERASEYEFDWEVLPAKPRKVLTERKLQFQLHPQIDFGDWEYSLVSYNKHEFFDVFLVPDQYDESITKDDYGTMGWIIVDGELGEELCIERVGVVSIVPRAEVDATSRIIHLHDHIRSLIPTAKV